MKWFDWCIFGPMGGETAGILFAGMVVIFIVGAAIAGIGKLFKRDDDTEKDPTNTNSDEDR